MKKITIAIADDHEMIRKRLPGHLQLIGDYEFLFVAADGKDFIDKLESVGVPDIALMDIHMPRMDGYETTQYLTKFHPEIKVLAMAVDDPEYDIDRIKSCGAKGFIRKGNLINLFREALDCVLNNGTYFPEAQ